MYLNEAAHGIAWIDPIRIPGSLWGDDRDGEEGRKEGVAGAINGNAPTQTDVVCARSIDGGAIFGGRRQGGFHFRSRLRYLRTRGIHMTPI